MCTYYYWEIFQTDLTDLTERRVLQTGDLSLPNFVAFLFNFYCLTMTAHLCLLFSRSVLCTTLHKWDSHPDTANYERNDVWQLHCNVYQKIFSIQREFKPAHPWPLRDRHITVLGGANHPKIHVRAPPDCHNPQRCPWIPRWTLANYAWTSRRSIWNTGLRSFSSYILLHHWNNLQCNKTIPWQFWKQILLTPYEYCL